MRHFITTVILFMFGISVLAQDVKIQGPRKQQSTVSKPKPKTSSGTQSRKPTAPLRWDDSLKAICYDGKTYPMIFVEGGTFTMGEKYDNGRWLHDTERYGDKRSDESVLVRSTLPSYYIGKFEVTQDLWEKVMGSNPIKAHQKEYGFPAPEFIGKRKPVTFVAPDPIKEFLSKLNNLTGLIFRLPTEEQWEFAARGGVKSQGYKYSGGNSLNSVGWYSENSGKTIHDVGMKSPNELGIYDMSGNVEELCDGEYGYLKNVSYIHSFDYVTRGGSYTDSFCTSTHRGRYDMHRSGCAVEGVYYVGFRIVLSEE